MKDIKGKILSIAILRCLATALITNTHFNSVWPSESLAVGGLLGDVLFFMISGYCLVDSKSKNFFTWYVKRILRIYPAIILMTLVNILVGYFSFSWQSAFSVFVYPTAFVFVGAIMVLYIPFFFYRKLITPDAYSNEIINAVTGSKFSKEKLSLIGLAAVFACYMLAYVFIVDKSEYWMNAVTHPITLFLYFTAMVSGATLKRIDFLKKTNNKLLWVLLCVMVAVVYAFLLTYVRNHAWTFNYQIVVNIVLLIAAAFIFKAVFQFEEGFKRILYPNGNTNSLQSKCVWKLSELTLDIYVVQRVIIDHLEGIVFPVNMLLIIPAIIAAALVVNYISGRISDGISKLLKIK